jgi:hypothetical protein
MTRTRRRNSGRKTNRNSHRLAHSIGFLQTTQIRTAIAGSRNPRSIQNRIRRTDSNNRSQASTSTDRSHNTARFQNTGRNLARSDSTVQKRKASRTSSRKQPPPR